MHQTTVRFATDVWSELEGEARRLGVSAAQYVRDATLARLAYTAGQRGDPFFGESREQRADASTIWAQAALARDRARTVREDAHAVHALVSQSRDRRRAPARGRWIEDEVLRDE